MQIPTAGIEEKIERGRERETKRMKMRVYNTQKGYNKLLLRTLKKKRILSIN